MRSLHFSFTLLVALLITPAIANAGFLFSDVTETANTPGDSTPLYGTPTMSGNQMDFDPAGFSAAAAGAGVDITDGQLNFTLTAMPGSAIAGINIFESGDYTLAGAVPPGTNATQVGYGLVLASATVVEVDGVAVTPINLAAASIAGGADLTQGLAIASPWNLELDYDVSAALAAEGVTSVLGATKIEFAINNTLVAIGETSSSAFVAKKNFTVTASAVPEPSSFLFLGLVMVGAVAWKRRTSVVDAE